MGHFKENKQDSLLINEYNQKIYNVMWGSLLLCQIYP